MVTTIKSPQDVPNLFAECWNQRNAAGIASLFANEAEFVNVVGLWWHNREDIEKAHDYGLKVIFNDSELKVLKTKVMFLEDHIALVHAKMRLKGQTNPNSESAKSLGERRNIFSFVVMLKNNKWECVSAHNTDIVPGKETNIVDDDGKFYSIDYRNNIS